MNNENHDFVLAELLSCGAVIYYTGLDRALFIEALSEPAKEKFFRSSFFKDNGNKVEFTDRGFDCAKEALDRAVIISFLEKMLVAVKEKRLQFGHAQVLIQTAYHCLLETDDDLQLAKLLAKLCCLDTIPSNHPIEQRDIFGIGENFKLFVCNAEIHAGIISYHRGLSTAHDINRLRIFLYAEEAFTNVMEQNYATLPKPCCMLSSEIEEQLEKIRGEIAKIYQVFQEEADKRFEELC